MGVPAFFRWLSKKYPSIVVHAVEEKGPMDADGNRTTPDCTLPNPNDVEFDNLYLDMNGIIHPCCHPEDRPAPKNEDEMMVLIFEYIDRIFAICRPRKLLYMAIDGVAPRAKMNQQRSRRFRASQESAQKHTEITKIREMLESQGVSLPPPKPDSEKFDSNCITPGTPFMFRLAECLRYYIHDRLNYDPAWKNLKVILSDANVPGEGEHKIMDYIRKQRGQPDHDPNTHHCLCGADADLIMLGLATHEPNFTIIREEFKPGKPRPCELCGQIGHELKECTGAAKEKQGEHDELQTDVSGVEFIFIRLNVLREYLSRDLLLTNINFKYEFERVIDDWIFMCFFVGNDFLPHLPSLEIREGAIDRLIKIYKATMHKTGGYLAKAGEVNLKRVQVILSALGEAEDEIFKKRRQDDIQYRGYLKRKRNDEKAAKAFINAERPKFLKAYKPGDETQEKYNKTDAAGMRNQNAAAQLKSMLYKDGETSTNDGNERRGQKREHEDSDSDPEPEDDVKLWEDGWRSRYYENKFGVDPDDIAFRHEVASQYAVGLCWVLRYYFQGCSSWKWYYPYHYAPFASDFVNIGDLPNSFEKGTKPFRPFEQLMAVFPAASCAHVPPTWRPLMYESDSPIIDFYPTNFKIDLNGKKWAWMGVALLPFVDERRLLRALTPKYEDLTEEEMKRSITGCDRLFVGKSCPAYDFMVDMYQNNDDQPLELSTKLTAGILGYIEKDEFVVLPDETVPTPIALCKDLPNNKAICVKYRDPDYGPDHVYPAVLLPGAKIPDPTLKPQDLMKDKRGNYGDANRGSRGGGSRGGGRGGHGGYRPQLGFTPNSGYRGNTDSSAANRMLGSSLRSAESNNIAPPNSYGVRGGYGARGGGNNYMSHRAPGPSYASHGGLHQQRSQPYSSSANRGGYQGNRGGYQGNRGGYGGGNSGGHRGGNSGGGSYNRGGYGGGGQYNNRGGYDRRGGSSERGGRGGQTYNPYNQRGGYSNNRYNQNY